jgi:enamine deaminase RidA (YjgF/YER057c/UK114 family)
VQLAFESRAMLEAAGCGFDDIIDVTTFHTQPEVQFEAVNTARMKLMGQEPYPNWTTIGVDWLASISRSR